MTTRNGLIGMVVATALAALPFAAFAAPPTVTITEGPDEGGTITEESVTFAFNTTEASTTRCSITGAEDDESFFSCGSPQTYELPNGEYRFVVEVSNDDGTETDERTFTVAIEEDSDGGGDSEEESESTPRVSSGGGTVRYQTPIYPDGPKVVMRPGTFAIVPSAENPYVSLASVTPVPQAQVAGAQTTTQPRTTATAPRSTVAQAPRTTTTTAPTPTTTPTTTPATTTATSAPFGVATTVPAGAALGALDGGVPNWVWAVLVAIVVLGVAGYAWSTTREV